MPNSTSRYLKKASDRKEKADSAPPKPSEANHTVSKDRRSIVMFPRSPNYETALEIKERQDKYLDFVVGKKKRALKTVQGGLPGLGKKRGLGKKGGRGKKRLA